MVEQHSSGWRCVQHEEARDDHPCAYLPDEEELLTPLPLAAAAPGACCLNGRDRRKGSGAKQHASSNQT